MAIGSIFDAGGVYLGMTVRKWAVRFVLLSGALVLFLGLTAFLAVQVQQRLLRWRSERLLADMHSIRLYQTNWDEAQGLMRRWGKWGYYEGSCTAASCKYEIELDSIYHYSQRVPRQAWLDWILKYDRLNLYEWFGGRMSVFHASFTVHEGTIWREGTWMGVSVPRKNRIRRVMKPDTVLTGDDFEWTLSVGGDSYQRLHRTLQSPFAYMGNDEYLAGHPYYRVGRPSGCKILCQVVSVYYSTHTPPAEIERLTAYDFSCFTRFKPCARIADLLPAAEEWHLYDSEYEYGPTVPKPKELPSSGLPLPRPVPCSKIPVWAQARDAHYVMAVEAISTKVMKKHEDYGDYVYEATKVKIIDSLKEGAPWSPDSIVSVRSPYSLEELSFARAEPGFEPMIPGRRYIVFAVGNDDRIQAITKDSPMAFERCGLREDTPEVRRELEKGFAQNDTLNP